MDNYNNGINNFGNVMGTASSNMSNFMSNQMSSGGTCPYLIMKICPMVANMKYPAANEMMPNLFAKSTYVKVKSVPISQLVE